MATKKPTNPSWGKTLTCDQLLTLLNKLDQKKKEREMSKMSDFLKRAADKKKGINHPEGADAPAVEKKVNKATAPAPGKKPPTRSAGRGR